MRLVQKHGLKCFKFPVLENLPGFFHGVFLRQTTKDKEGTGHFDLGLGCGTPDEEVWHNRNKMLDFFGDDYCGGYACQVHGKDVCLLRNNSAYRKKETNRFIKMTGDALITNVKGVALVIQVADCQPVIIVDPLSGVVANIHSGWRGSLQNIIGETISRMKAEYGCCPENLICGIGPSLGPCCAEFKNFEVEIPEEFWSYRIAKNKFDFWQISIEQLTKAGIRSSHISLAGMCTKCNQHLFFSYRGEHNTGRFAAVVGVHPTKEDL